MKQNFRRLAAVAVPLAAVMLIAHSGAIRAQITAEEQVSAEDSAAVETDPSPEADPALSVIDRWRAAPETIFDATEIDLDALQFVARPLIVMASSPNDPMVREQLGFIQARFSELVARDVIVILDTDPASGSAIRAQLRPHGFSMVLIGKDGRLALRKPFPWDVREIVHTIDRLPIRQQELRGG